MSRQPLPRARILVVDDDVTVAEILSRYLVREGYEVDCAFDGPAALEQATLREPDLIVLDLMLPGLSGLDVCRRLRSVAQTPIIMLTARGEERDRIFGLKLGADDYVVKPFSPREVTARVESVLRRANGPAEVDEKPRALTAGSFEIDIGERTVLVDGKPATLTAREFDLLAFFVQHPGQVFSRDELLERVWGYRFGDTATVTVHIRRLRTKVEADPRNPVHLKTVWGVGYRFRQ